jgi:hypothetical protein
LEADPDPVHPGDDDSSESSVDLLKPLDDPVEDVETAGQLDECGIKVEKLWCSTGAVFTMASQYSA